MQLLDEERNRAAHQRGHADDDIAVVPGRQEQAAAAGSLCKAVCERGRLQQGLLSIYWGHEGLMPSGGGGGTFWAAVPAVRLLSP